MWTLSQRITLVENELNELDKRLESAVNQYSKQFEKKIQDMTFAYTKNLDDTKSDYLKRYLEQRMDGMQYDISQIPLQIAEMKQDFHQKIEKLEHLDD
jgi:uncharacterized protein YicC (UPF0701 family)